MGGGKGFAGGGSGHREGKVGGWEVGKGMGNGVYFFGSRQILMG